MATTISKSTKNPDIAIIAAIDASDFEKDLVRLGKAADRAADRISDKINNAFSFNASMAASIATGVGAVGAVTYTSGAEFNDTNKALAAASTSQEQYEERLRYTADAAELLGRKVNAVKKDYANFALANQRAMTEGQMRERFLNLQIIADARGMEPERLKQAITALNQIQGKGKLTAEELRGQLAEAMPDALAIFSDALGVTTTQLSEMIDSGKLNIKDMDAFWSGLGKEAQAAADLTNTASKEYVRLQNTISEGSGNFLKAGGDDAAIAFLKGLDNLVNVFYDSLISFAPLLEEMGEWFGGTFSLIANWIQQLNWWWSTTVMTWGDDDIFHVGLFEDMFPMLTQVDTILDRVLVTMQEIAGLAFNMDFGGAVDVAQNAAQEALTSATQELTVAMYNTEARLEQVTGTEINYFTPEGVTGVQANTGDTSDAE